MERQFAVPLALLLLGNSMWNVLPLFDQIESTSDYLKLHANVLPSLTLVQTRYQTQGRGQFDRKWESTHGENLLFSFIVKNVPIVEHEMIRTWVIRSLMEWITSHQLIPHFKLPNDILVEGKKILGILIETRTWGDDFKWIVIGIGININQIAFAIETATSLKLLKGRTYDLANELATIMTKLAVYYPWGKT